MSESRELAEQRLWGTPGLWGRPPTGSWPPCPPGPRPPDCFSNLFRIEQCYEDVIQLKRFLTRIMTEIMQSDPGLNVRIQGVTDGSDAAPGEVGEYLRQYGTLPVPGDGTTVMPVATLRLTAGDWQVSGQFGFDGVACRVAGADIAPALTGDSYHSTGIGLILDGGATLQPGGSYPLGGAVRVSLAQPGEVILRVHVESVGNVPVPVWGSVWARRMR